MKKLIFPLAIGAIAFLSGVGADNFGNSTEEQFYDLMTQHRGHMEVSADADWLFITLTAEGDGFGGGAGEVIAWEDVSQGSVKHALRDMTERVYELLHN